MDELRMLKEAAGEIKYLRAQNQAIGDRLEVYDNMMALFKADPHLGMGSPMRPDVVFEMDKRIHELETINNQKNDQKNI